MEPIRILIIATSHDQLGNTKRKTGLWLEELAVPYYIFLEAGSSVTLASPKGGRIPLDPKSESIIMATPATKRFLKDPVALSWLAGSVLLSEQSADDFDLVFLPGGHGPMWDFMGDASLKLLLEEFIAQHKGIGAVCHGVAALLESEISKLGARYSKGPNFAGHIVMDRQIITGQNPASSGELAKMLLLSRLIPLNLAEAALQLN